MENTLNKNSSASDAQRFRAFIAVPMPKTLRSKIQHAVTALRQDVKHNPDLKKLRWSRPDNYHLTVAFLGDIPETLVPDLQKNLQARLDRQVPFSIVMTEIKPFPEHRPHVLAAMFTDSPELLDLYRGVVYALQDSGLGVERRKFLPHLTLARKQYRANRLNLQSPIVLDLELMVENIILYRSNLSNQGARHDVVFSIPFTAHP